MLVPRFLRAWPLNDLIIFSSLSSPKYWPSSGADLVLVGSQGRESSERGRRAREAGRLLWVRPGWPWAEESARSHGCPWPLALGRPSEPVECLVAPGAFPLLVALVDESHLQQLIPWERHQMQISTAFSFFPVVVK